MLKKKLPHFDSFNRNHYWLGYPTPTEMIFMIAINGQLDIDKLKTAAKNELLATPLFQTKITSFLFFIRRKFLNLNNAFDINQIFSVDYEPKGDSITTGKTLHRASINILNDFIDINQELPLRFYVLYRTKNKPVFIIKINDTVTDGVGAFIFISRIIQEYNILVGGRNIIQLPSKPWDHSYKKLKKQIKNNKKQTQSNPKIKLGYIRDTSALQGTLKACTHVLSKKQFTALKKFSSETDLTINDIMVGAIAIAIYKSLLQRNQDFDHIIIELPINLRKDLGIEGVIGNFFTIIQISINHSEFKDQVRLLMTIKDKIKSTMESKEYIKNMFRPSLTAILPTKLIISIIKKNQEKILLLPPHFTTGISNVGKLDSILETPHKCTIEFAWSATSPHYSIGKHWILTTYDDKLSLVLIYMDPIINDKSAHTEIKMALEEFSNILKIDQKKFKKTFK